MSYSHAFIFFIIQAVVSHTWVDQVCIISLNGTFVGNYGYPRAYVPRTSSTDAADSNTYMLPPLSSGRLRINELDYLCHPSQRTRTKSSSWPRLKATPGDFIAMKYAENGHVTLADNIRGKPAEGGVVFVYGTSAPKDDERIMNVLQWNNDSSGGDRRGRLLAWNNFDDGRCYQLNRSPLSLERQKVFPNPTPGQPGSSNEQSCETDAKIPLDVPAGTTYTLYWIWEWPTTAGADPTYPDGKDEWYTTCLDVDIVGSTERATFHANGPLQLFPMPQQDPQSAAVRNYRSRSALIAAPTTFSETYSARYQMSST
ncbi:hypothetical protein MPH_13690 [Macrophomina phaseolina MS6]|uniref:DUF7492 domain-containing protein n=1 Tax=Macrophomina phaseolina (strain MS6) TaxID=1126212 RepID=K2RXV6_MACPH|nr:hypothetical protein MPH_13690 [Macrophomina phaseolina MS6]